MILCANPAAQFASHQAEIEAATLRVMRSNRYILGTEVEALEKKFAAYSGAKYGIGVANGTDALELAVRALGIGAGDEVITVSHTAVATVAAIEATGAEAVLADVDEATFTLDPSQLPSLLTARTKAVIAVHLYGQAADLDAIGKFCQENALFLIEDGSQAHGAIWSGRRVGGIGDIGCFSCYPTKNLGAIGDAGLVTTNDAELMKKVRMLREYGWQSRYISDIAGRNSRLDELQAAILSVKLKYLDESNAKRRAIANRYNEGIKNPAVSLPTIRAMSDSVFHLYVLRTTQRQALMNHLEHSGVQTGIHYPVPIHMQPAYKGRIRTAASMQVTERLAGEVLSLPIYPELSEPESDQIIQAINNFVP